MVEKLSIALITIRNFVNPGLGCLLMVTQFNSTCFLNLSARGEIEQLVGWDLFSNSCSSFQRQVTAKAVMKVA
jgi:hypothetical protein